ncbi:MAG: autotransporter-associated beta strand repeat-containing protein, partial [Akkermansia sp.]
YTGGTIIKEGTVKVGNLASTGTGSIKLEGAKDTDKATLDLAVADFAKAITITKDKFGTLAGANADTYKGALTVNGNLSLGSTASATSIAAGSLTTGAGSILNFDVASTTSYDKITLGTSGAGALSLDAGTTFNLNFASGVDLTENLTFNFISGTIAGGAISQYTVTGLDAEKWGYEWLYAGTQLSLKITIKASDLVWAGTGATPTWNTTAENKMWTSKGASVAFVNGQSVLFDDTATVKAVTLEGDLNPKNIEVNNSASNDYTFSGAGKIVGNGALKKKGAGNLTILTSNSSTGILTIEGGNVLLGNGTTSGSWAGNIVNNGTLTINPNGTLAMSNNISGTGSLVKAGTGTLSFNSDALTATNSTFSGGTTVNGGILQLGNGKTTPGTYQLGTGAITLNNNSQVNLFLSTEGANSYTFTNNWIVNGTSTIYQENGGISNTLSGSITLNANATLELKYRWSTNFSLTGKISGDTTTTLLFGNLAQGDLGGDRRVSLTADNTGFTGKLKLNYTDTNTATDRDLVLSLANNNAAKDATIELLGGNVAGQLSILEVNTANATIAGLSGNANSQIKNVGDNRTLTLTGGTSTFAGLITDTLALTQTGGVLTLSGVNTSTGKLTISGTKLILGGANGNWAGIIDNKTA